MAGIDPFVKSAKSRLQKLDMIGIGPEALQAMLSRDFKTMLDKAPLLNKYQYEKADRKRRIKEELHNPGQHLDPKIVARLMGINPNAPQGPAAPGGPAASFTPMSPGAPLPPSNLSGMFPAASQPEHMIKASDGEEEEGAESPKEEEAESMDPAVVEQLINFIVSQGRGIDDERFHQQAETLGADPHEAEEEMYRLIAGLVGGKNDVVRGGLSAGMPTSMFPPKQIEKGQEVELEHTPSVAVATEIAKDHLVEGEDYYDPRLEDLEKDMEKDKEEGKIEGVGEETSKAKKNIATKEKNVEQLRKNSFKYGFFKKVAECGMTPRELEDSFRLSFEKTSASFLGGALAEHLGNLVKWMAHIGAGAGKLGLGIPIAMAPLLGAAAGGSTYYLTRPKSMSTEDIQHAERLGLYKRLIRQARSKSKARVKEERVEKDEESTETKGDDAHRKILPMKPNVEVE